MFQVPVQWSYSGFGSDTSVPAGRLLHQTFLQGTLAHVSSVSAHFSKASMFEILNSDKLTRIYFPSVVPVILVTWSIWMKSFISLCNG